MIAFILQQAGNKHFAIKIKALQNSKPCNHNDYRVLHVIPSKGLLFCRQGSTYTRY